MIWLFFSFVILSVTSAAHMPSYMVPCSKSKNFTTCALKHAEEAIPFLLKGDKRLGLPNFCPLAISEINVSGASFNVSLKNLKVYGLEKTKPFKLQVDFDKRKAQVLSTVPALVVIGTHSIHGRILIFQLNGNGPVNITLTNGVYEYGFDWGVENRNGVNYGKILNSNFDYRLKGVNYHFENVVNNNKELSEHINKFLNDNWKVVNEDLRDSIRETLLAIHNQLFEKIFTQIPLNELFLD